MSIESQITSINQDIVSAEAKIVEMGGTISNHGSAFLAESISSIPQGGSSHGYKKWTVTLPSSMSSGKLLFVQSDPDVALHYDDDNAIARFIYDGDVSTLTASCIIYQTNGNILLMNGSDNDSGFYTIRNTSNTGNSRVGVATKLKEANSRTAILASTASGDLSFITYSSRILHEGTYTVEFWW